MAEEILSEFIEDAREHLQAANEHLLALEQDPTRRDDLHGLLRRLHSIKGNAGFLSLDPIYELTHKAEDVLQGLRESGLACPAELIDVLFRVLDTLEAMIAGLEAGGSAEVKGQAGLVEQLEEIGQVLRGDPVEPLVEEAAPAEEAVSAAGSEPSPAEEKGPLPQVGLAQAVQGLGDRLAGWSDSDQDPGRLKDLLADVETLHPEVECLGGPGSRQAMKLIEGYLDQVDRHDPPLLGPVRSHLAGLVENLGAWLEAEGRADPRLQVIRPSLSDLEGEEAAAALQARVGRLVEQGLQALVFDLRGRRSLGSVQIGALVAAARKVPNRKKVGLVVDSQTQPGLIRILRLLKLDQVFRLFKDEAQAREALV